MSLINKMLQDLDARGNARSDGMSPEIKPVAGGAGRGSILRVAAITAAVLVAILAAAAWLLLPIKGKTFDPQPLPPPISQTVPPTAPAAAPAAPARVEPPASAAPAEETVADAAKTPDEAAVPAPEKARVPSRPASTKAAPAPREAAPRTARRESGAAGEEVSGLASGGVSPGRSETASQAADNAYRRALANLQEGRVSEAMAGLQAVLRVNPGHEAARQTLVGLLIEANRGEEAMAQLQQGLSLDPRQPAMAMLLARLQIERGKPGIDTLLRTLPYASGNGEYHAFLGGALQRQSRYAEAAEQYRSALRAAPDNAVWWMGLGLALQEDKRNAEAADALRQAKALGTLSPDLQAYVERRLARLAP